MIIYLDMDDVVADWISYAQEFLKMLWDKDKGERIPQSDWDKLKNDSRFYLNLPLKEGAVELVDYCQKAVASKKVNGLAFLTVIS